MRERECVCVSAKPIFWFHFNSSSYRFRLFIEPTEPSPAQDAESETATQADESSQQQQQPKNKPSGGGRDQPPPPTALHVVSYDRSLLRSSSPGRLHYFGTQLSVRCSPSIRSLRASSAKRKVCGVVQQSRLKSAKFCW